MCLNHITKEFNPPDTSERGGWKVLIESAETLRTPFIGLVIPKNTWQDDYENEPPIIHIEAHSGGSYCVGIHVFATREAALEHVRLLPNCYGRFLQVVIAKVTVRNVMYEGTDASDYSKDYLEANLPVLVAREMRVDSVEQLEPIA